MSILAVFLWGAGATAVLVLYVYFAGKAAEKAHQKAVAMTKAFENMEAREMTNDEIEKITPDDRRKRLHVWVRNGE